MIPYPIEVLCCGAIPYKESMTLRAAKNLIGVVIA
jgi:hypothetical protein